MTEHQTEAGVLPAADQRQHLHFSVRHQFNAAHVDTPTRAAIADERNPRLRRVVRVWADENYSIRRGQAKDQEFIADTVRKEKLNPLGVKAERFSVAVNEKDEILGFGQIERFDGDRPFIEVRSMVVMKSRRRQGIGSKILDDLCERNGDDLPMFLTTVEGGDKEFYEKKGFEEVSIRSPGVPWAMIVEMLAGIVVARIIVKKQLFLMRKTAPNAIIPGS